MNQRIYQGYKNREQEGTDIVCCYCNFITTSSNFGCRDDGKVECKNCNKLNDRPWWK